MAAFDNLSDKHKRFVDEYLQCLNATQAYINAGYSENAANVNSSRLMANDSIRASIQEKMQATLQADEVLFRLAAQARGDMGDFIDPETLTVDLKRARELGNTHLIKRIKQTIITKDDEQFETFEFELYDAQKALALLGKYHKLFVDRTELTGADGTPLLQGLIINIGGTRSEPD